MKVACRDQSASQKRLKTQREISNPGKDAVVVTRRSLPARAESMVVHQLVLLKYCVNAQAWGKNVVVACEENLGNHMAGIAELVRYAAVADGNLTFAARHHFAVYHRDFAGGTVYPNFVVWRM